MVMRNKRLIGILITVGVLLLIPFVAQQFTGEVKWSPFDFVVAAVLVLGAGLACEIALRVVKKTQHRIIACAMILMLLFVVWAELAVGLIGTRFAGS